MRSKSSIDRLIPASCAIASRCSTALVEPPVMHTDAIAFSMASRVTICFGLTSFLSRSITNWPDLNATSGLRGSVAGTLLKPKGEIPISSLAVAMVLAVNCPPHAPTPGHATSSRSFNSLSVILPAACAPTASKTSTIVTS